MKTTCLINNYNYGQFISAAIDSALNQTIKFDEIIVVDDGSTDNSKDVIATYANRITAVFKRNEGQLSAFNAGFAASSGELICFLDADDSYEPGYLESLLKLYGDNATCNFTFSAYLKFGAVNELVSRYPTDSNLGVSAVLANQKMSAIGGPTSTIAMKRDIAKKLLPYQFVDEWISRADDILIWGSSLVGAHKFYHSRPLVRYRVHAVNAWHGKTFSADVRFKRGLATKRFFTHIRTAMGYDSNLSDLAHHEFRTHSRPTLSLLFSYFSIVSTGVTGRGNRLRYYLKLIAHYFKTR